jgi:hypothetical protein
VPQLDQLFERSGLKAWGEAQCFEAKVIAVTSQGTYVVLPSFDPMLRWGPCRPADLEAKVGDAVSVVISEQGVPWVVGSGGGGGGDSGGGNIDGGFPDSVYGGVSDTDGGVVS